MHNSIGKDRTAYDACCRLFPSWGSHRVEDGDHGLHLVTDVCSLGKYAFGDTLAVCQA